MNFNYSANSKKEYKNCDLQNIDKNKEVKNEGIAPELDVLLNAINFVITRTMTKTMKWMY